MAQQTSGYVTVLVNQRFAQIMQGCKYEMQQCNFIIDQKFNETSRLNTVTFGGHYTLVFQGEIGKSYLFMFIESYSIKTGSSAHRAYVIH